MGHAVAQGAGAQAGATLPVAKPMISVAAGLWVGVLALRMWRMPGQGVVRAGVTPRTVLITTFLNPKALVFGLVLVPAAPALPLELAGFAAMLAGVAAGWAAAGAFAAGPGDGVARRVIWVRRASALWLAALSVGLVLRGLTA